MKLPVFKILVVVMIFVRPALVVAQDEPKTIKIKRESSLVKAVFDNTELRLVIVDRFGNPRENKILSYQLWVKGKRETKNFPGHSNSLDHDMLDFLKKQGKATKIFFTEVKAEDDDGHIVKLPDVIETWFPDCMNCDKNKKRR